MQLGDAYEELVASLAEAVEESGCAVRSFHEMTTEEVAQVCGLSLSDAALARDREFDEAFLIADEARAPALLAAIERKGKRWTHGGRFYHILGKNDKAAAVGTLLELYGRGGERVRSIGIGDGLNDAGFLNVVDVPILVRTEWLGELRAAVPGGTPTQFPGPRGWSDAMVRLFG